MEELRAITASHAAENAADLKLVAAIRSGDPMAFETIVRKHGGRMLATAKRFLPCEQDACDAVQDAFLSAFKSITTFNGDSQIATWLHRIVVNASLMRLRSNVRRATCSIENLLPTFDRTGHHAHLVGSIESCPTAGMIADEIRSQVRGAIDSLPEDYRRVVLLRDIEQIDTESTASLLGVSTAVVKTRLHRARQALRTLLEPTMKPL
jgi:RNA polymerase sigma-70 factor, ECF subfamily